MGEEAHAKPAAGSDLTDDGFLGERLKILQPAKGHRSGLDAVMLAASVPAIHGERALDVGCGAGVAALCLARRVQGLEVRGIDIQAGLVALAGENAARNGLEERARFIEADVAAPRGALSEKDCPPHSFDHVMANPPFYAPGTTWTPPDAGKSTAHIAEGADLALWVDFCCAMARPKGTVSFIHRADALGGLLGAIGTKLGGLVIYPLWPAPGKAARRLLVQGIKGSRAPLAMLPGLVLHGEEGGFEPEAEAVLRHGEALDFSVS
ncbi:tRNA1(Val) (adenine(37)-N6)-methyltransferase [Tepidicaulis sp.]|uniref:tRNA1(Val) (adenine(37)-N6)-methyltransferase n=1 Tax=Tepidicaulis sp. TaxID=1920809 RepID=UPI003B5A0F22